MDRCQFMLLLWGVRFLLIPTELIMLNIPGIHFAASELAAGMLRLTAF